MAGTTCHIAYTSTPGPAQAHLSHRQFPAPSFRTLRHQLRFASLSFMTSATNSIACTNSSRHSTPAEKTTMDGACCDVAICAANRNLSTANWASSGGT